MKKSFIKLAALALAACMGAGMLASCGGAPKEAVEQNTETSGQTEIQKTDAPEMTESPQPTDSADTAE